MKRNFKVSFLEEQRVDRRELAFVQGGEEDDYCGCACAGGYMSDNAIDNGSKNAQEGIKDGTDFICIRPSFVIGGGEILNP